MICRKLLISVLSALVVVSVAKNEATAAVCLDPMTSEGATYREVELGNYTADAMCAATGADLAVIPGSMLAGGLGFGTVTEENIAAVIAGGGDQLVLGHISPAQLKQLLEISVSHIVLTEEETVDYDQSDYWGYLQVSGFRYTYNPVAYTGERVMRVTLMNGDELDLTDTEPTLLLCAPASLFRGEYAEFESGFSVIEPNLRQALWAYISKNGTTPGQLGRIVAAGIRDFELIDYIPRPVLYFAVIAFLLLGFFRPKATRNKNIR